MNDETTRAKPTASAAQELTQILPELKKGEEIKAILFPCKKLFLLSDCGRLEFSGRVFELAFRTNKKGFISLYDSLERRFLMSVVHAGLAKIMRKLIRLRDIINTEGKYPFGNLRKRISGSVTHVTMQFSFVILKLGTLAFNRIVRHLYRRQLLFDCNNRVGCVEDYLLKFLCSAGDLRIISDFNCSFSEMKGCVECSKCGAKFHEHSFS